MKKGFTLVELISTIIIIGVIALISVPVTQYLIESSKQKAYNIIIDNIEEAASNYSVYNEIGYNELFKALEVSEIQEQGYLTMDNIIDPRDDSVINGCVLYRWRSAIKKYEFRYSDNCNAKDFYPEITINVLNDNNKYWMNEKLKFNIEGEYREFRYCIANSNEDCIKDIDYITDTEIEELGEDIHVCATGYFGEEVGNSTCTKAYNIDYVNPEISFTTATTTNKIVVNPTCNDAVSGVNKIEYSINNGSYQSSPIFTNLKTGTYNIKVKCTDNAERYTIESKDVTLPNIKPPVIVQASQYIEGYTIAQGRTIRITYSNENIEKPYYYYSLDGKTWIEVDTKVHDITFTKNGYLYAKTLDETGNVATASTYTVMNIDSTAPSTSIASQNVMTDRTTIKATCSDAESGIAKYEFSKDNGSTWESNGTNPIYTFTGLSQGTSYAYKVRCTNGSGMTNTASVSEKTQTISNPTIAQLSQTISGYEWAQSRTIRITYYNTNIASPKYYYSLDGSTWIEVSNTTKDVTFTSNGYLYAKTVDSSGNTANASTYAVIKIDTTKPDKPTIAASDGITNGNWHTSNFSLNYSGSSAPSGITYYYGTSTSSVTSTGSSKTIQDNTASTTYYVKACSGSGVCSDVSSYVVKLDKTVPPIPTISASDGKGSNVWHSSNFTLNYSGSSTTSNTTTYKWRTSSASGTGNSIISTETTGTTYYVKACNIVGCSNESSYVVKLDKTKPPTPTITASDGITNGNWHTSNFSLNYSGSSASSGITYYYGTSTSSMTSTGSSKTIQDNTASTTYYVKACSGSSVCSDVTSYVVKLDKTTPTTYVTYANGYNIKAYQNYYKIQLSSSTTYSGINHYEVDWDNDGVANTTTSSTFEPWDGWWSDGNTRFRAVTNAGTYGPWTTGYSIFRNASIAINPLANGNYAIRTMGNTNYSLDISGGNISSGINIQLWSYNGSNAQKWYIEHLGSGYYKITSKSNTSLSLDIVDGNQANGTNIRLYSWNNSNAQKFIILTAVDGGYFLMSSSGYMIEVSGGNFTNGTNIQLYGYIGGPAQRWEFRSITEPNLAYTSWSNWSEVSSCSASDTVECKTETITTPGAQHYNCTYTTSECNKYATTAGESYYGTTAPSGSYTCISGTDPYCRKWDWNNLNKSYSCPMGYDLSDDKCYRSKKFTTYSTCASNCSGGQCQAEASGVYICIKTANVTVNGCNSGWVGPVDASDNPLGKSCYQYQYTKAGSTYCSEYKTATKDVTSCGGECTSCNSSYQESSSRNVTYKRTRSSSYNCTSGTLVGNSCIN